MDDMGKCEIYNDEMWQDYLLNKLSREELEKAQFHLHQCAFCWEKLMRMRSMVRDIQNEGKEEKGIFRMQPVLRITAVIALILMFSAGGYYFMQLSSDGSTIIVTPPPIHDSLDSAKTATDSLDVVNGKDTILYKYK
jgi:hypothetical protein